MKIRIPGILLVYYNYPNTNAQTIIDHIESFERYSAFPIYTINALYDFPNKLAQYQFDAIIFHYTAVAEGPKTNYGLSDKLMQYFKESKNIKIGFFQDEYHYCQKRFKFINDLSIDTVFSCYEQPHIQNLYGTYTKAKHFITYIPGHISEDLHKNAPRFSKPIAQRTIDIGYRGRSLPFYMGSGAREKYRIGLELPKLLESENLNLDIAVDEESRIYGDSWYRFLGNCKAILGTESGVGITDVNDTIKEEVSEYLIAQPKSDFNKVFEDILIKYEGIIPLRTISPRHFEACVFKIVQILFEGSYSSILIPDQHYIPLKKDYSNLQEVLIKLRNQEFCNRIRENAYQDIALNEKYYYSSLIKQLDQHLINEFMYECVDLKQDRIQSEISPSFFKFIKTYSRHKDFPGKSFLKRIKDQIL